MWIGASFKHWQTTYDGQQNKMTVKLDTRSIESPVATEIYISATPNESAPPQGQAQEIFSGIRDILLSKGAYILQERVFSAPAVMEIVSGVRLNAYSGIDDGVAPSFLCGKEGILGPVAGVLIHAVKSHSRPERINVEGSLNLDVAV